MKNQFLPHRRSAAIALLACAAAWAPWAPAQSLAAPALVVGHAGSGIQSAYAINTPQWRDPALAPPTGDHGGLRTADDRHHQPLRDAAAHQPQLTALAAPATQTALPAEAQPAAPSSTPPSRSAIPSFGVVLVASLVLLMALAGLRQVSKPHPAKAAP